MIRRPMHLTLTKTFLTAFIAGAVALTSCGDNHDHSTDGADTEVSDMGDDMHNAAEKVKDAAGNVVEEVKETAGEIREDLEGLQPVLADMVFNEGTVEYSIKGWMENGTGEQTFVLDKVPLDGEEVSAEGKEQLDKLAALLKAYPDVKCEIQAHTPKAKNAVGATTKKAWSSTRAFWVKTKLTVRGVDGGQLDANGYGDEQLLPNLDPMDDNQRRIALKLSK